MKLDLKKEVIRFWKEEDGFLGAIIGAVAKYAIGKKIASDKRRNAVSDALLKGTHIRESAERAGFNPLTFLEATAGQGFGDYSSPPLASQELMSGAVEDIVGEVTGSSEAERKRTELENDLLALQVEKLRAEKEVPALGRRAVPVGNTRAADGNGNTWTLGDPFKRGPVRFDAVGNPLTPGAAAGGLRWQSNPWTSDAEVIEQRHGDLAQILWGAVSVPSDIWYNRKWIMERVFPTKESMEKFAKEKEQRRREIERRATGKLRFDIGGSGSPAGIMEKPLF